MILNVSYNDKKTLRLINQSLGDGYTWLQKFKNKHYGLSNISLIESTGTLKELLESNNDGPKFNIETRPNGILIYFRRYLETYALLLPFSNINSKMNHLFVNDTDYTAIFLLKENRESKLFLNFISHQNQSVKT